MLHGSYSFTVRLLENAHLPPYKGSTLRGAFGAALKKAVCTTRKQACTSCILVERCLYARTFERSARTPAALRQAAPPLPYVLNPPATTQTRFSSGDTLTFQLNLFGDANDSLPYFVFAFEQMGTMGLGKRLTDGRGCFTLEKITHDGHELYCPAAHRLTPARPTPLILHDPAPHPCPQLTVTLHTPLRFKAANHLRAELPFEQLVRLMLRRISSVFTCYGDGEPSLDYRGLIATAASVPTVASNVRWFDWERYSNRQRLAMQMGGLLGQVSYHDVSGEYWPLLHLARQLNIGKQTTFGLGQFDFDWPKAP